MSFLGLGKLVKGVGQIADDLHTSDEERLKAAHKDKELDAALLAGQMEINVQEAKHPSVFVAGWRPFIGWVGGVALAYQFVLYPLLTWLWALAVTQGWLPKEVAPPPVLDSPELMTLVLGMLGVGTMRTVDKVKGVQTDKVERKKKKKK